MSIASLIIGNSGTGKSTSLRNLDPAKTLIVQCINKPLPFKSKGWSIRSSENKDGNVYQTSNPKNILAVLEKSNHDVIIIDDYQASMVDELMNKSSQKGFDKFTELAKHSWEIFQKCGSRKPHQRVYIMAHTQTDEFGQIKMKTVGKMVDQTIVPEGYFTIVLRTDIVNNQYVFRTQTNGADCCKSPMGMFEQDAIENDLHTVDKTICEFYGINN